MISLLSRCCFVNHPVKDQTKLLLKNGKPLYSWCVFRCVEDIVCLSSIAPSSPSVSDVELEGVVHHAHSGSCDRHTSVNVLVLGSLPLVPSASRGWHGMATTVKSMSLARWCSGPCFSKPALVRRDFPLPPPLEPSCGCFVGTTAGEHGLRPPAPVNHANIFKGRSRRYASGTMLIQNIFDWSYWSGGNERFNHVE